MTVHLLLALLWTAAADAAAPATSGPGTPAQPLCDWKVATVPVRGSIAAALGNAIPQDGAQLAAHYARIFMWDLDLRRDVVPGDVMTVAWRRTPAGELEIGAASYLSHNRPPGTPLGPDPLAAGKTLRAYRFQAPTDIYPSYWDENGQEIPRRLKASPLAQYEQITALLKDRPTHQGMDFKTPTGTEIVAPRAGTVTRRDWKLRGNGRCLEIRYHDGVLAKFLHLSALKVDGGARVRPGQVVALTGNTGRSTAPHLHYQLERGGRTLDPIDYHGSTRRRLEGQAHTDFKAAVARLGAACPGLAP